MKSRSIGYVLFFAIFCASCTKDDAAVNSKGKLSKLSYVGTGSIVQYTYNKDGDPEKAVVFSSPGIEQTIMERTFLSPGKLKSEMTYVVYGSGTPTRTLEPRFNFELVYDSNGWQIQRTRFDLSVANDKGTITDYINNAKGLPVTETYRVANIIFLKVEYTYDAKGNVISMDRYEDKSAKGTLIFASHTEYEYDDHPSPQQELLYFPDKVNKNNIIKTTVTNASGQKSIVVFTYTYNDAGLPVLKKGDQLGDWSYEYYQ